MPRYGSIACAIALFTIVFTLACLYDSRQFIFEAFINAIQNSETKPKLAETVQYIVNNPVTMVSIVFYLTGVAIYVTYLTRVYVPLCYLCDGYRLVYAGLGLYGLDHLPYKSVAERLIGGSSYIESARHVVLGHMSATEWFGDGNVDQVAIHKVAHAVIAMLVYHVVPLFVLVVLPILAIGLAAKVITVYCRKKKSKKVTKKQSVSANQAN